MADAPVTRRIADVARDVAEAHACVERGDAVGSGWRARLAAEAMLHVLCEVHAVPVPGAVAGEPTIATLRKALRHAKVLDRRLEDHFAHVQNVGNRAAHAQREPDLAVDLAEARALLPVLDHVWQGFLAKIPAELHPRDEAPAAPRRGRWLGSVLVGVGMLALPVAAFLVVVTALGPAPVAPPARTSTPAATAPRTEALVREAPVPPPAPPDVVTTVRAERLVAPNDLHGLGCDTLAIARNWLWARRGLHLREDPVIPGAPGYFPFTDDVDAVRGRFSETDEANLVRLNAALHLAGCPCPRKPDQPCPR